MKKFMLPLLCIIALCGCKTVETKSADVIEIILSSNPTTGYSWEYTVSGDGEIEEASHEYTPSLTSVLGSGGIEVFRFNTKKEGTVKITFSYLRPWEGTAIETREYSYRIDNNLTATVI